MKLHMKFSTALLSTLVLVVVVAQFAQYLSAIALISDLSEYTVKEIKEREEGIARTVFDFIERVVAGSLESGEMEKFSKLLEAQKDIEGLREFSLYDRNGCVTHSSNQSCLKKTLPDEVRERLSRDSALLVRHTDGVIEIYRPQVVSKDCLKCHTSWEVGSSGGVVGIKFSVQALSRAQDRTAGTLSRAKTTFLSHCLITLTAIVVLFIITMYFSVSWFVKRPLERISKGLKDLSEGEGDLTRRLEVVSRDELGELAGYFNTFMEKLQSMVGQVQRSGLQVSTCSRELAATAREQEATMRRQMESTHSMLRAVKEISTVASNLLGTMQEVAAMSQETAGFASKGQADLARMEEAMHSMENGSLSISNRLEAINEKAENITTVVTTITKVADRTNLLSLNAAIEAEKAGEYGRGFMVVSREIRRLADQTAVATLDIDQMVKEMQGAVSAGVMEMDKFIARVQHSVEDVDKISVQLSRITDQVQALLPNFENVNVSMGHQSQSAQQISANMSSLSEQMQQTMESLNESFLAIGQLHEAAKGLQEEVSRFKVS